MYDWSSYFEDKTLKTSLKVITQMYHFHFSQNHPGKVKVQNNTTANWRIISLYKDPSWRPSDFPQQLIPPGLSLEQQQYIYKQYLNFAWQNVKIWCVHNHNNYNNNQDVFIMNSCGNVLYHTHACTHIHRYCTCYIYTI